jgi:hypothetical protein
MAPTPGPGITNPEATDRTPRPVWWLIFGTALLPHGLVFALMCFFWSVEAHRVDGRLHWPQDSVYILLGAYAEVLLLPAGLLISLILSRSPGTRRIARAMLAGTIAGFLVVVGMACVVNATAG